MLFRFLAFFSIFFSLSLTQNVFGQAPKYSNEFLSIGIGARALGMGNSYVSSVNDVTSGYWNPAGLTRIEENMQVSLMHAEYFAGIGKYDYGSFAAKIDETSALGVSLIRFGVDNIPNTIDLIDNNGNINYDRITSFSVADYAVLISYAKKLGIENLSVGGNVKIIRRVVGEFANAWGFGLDAGMQYAVGGWRFGAVARDVTSTFNAWSFTLNDRTQEVFLLTNNQIPTNSLEVTLPRLILGVAKNFEMGESFNLITEANLINTFDGRRNTVIKTDVVSIEPSFGFELGFKKIVFLRGGVGNIQQATTIDNTPITSFQPNLGIGVKIKNFTIDYALTDIGNQSEALYSNIFSLRLDITRKDRLPKRK
jgi:hypothetical protein